MTNKTLDEYIEYIKNSEEKYQWPLEKLDERLIEREKVHKEYPYVVTVALNYYSMDDINDILREKLGDQGGECGWRECEFSYATWHKETGLENQLQRKLYPLNKKQKDELAIRSDYITEHYAMIDKRLDKPGKHSHWGVWTTFWIVKTGYDYGYNDYCFKHDIDWLRFLFWNFTFDSIETHIKGERK